MAYVYKHLKKNTSEVFYIGIGSNGNHKRAYSTKARNKHWHNIVNKYGYKVEIIEDNLTWEEACEREKYWIKHYGRKDLREGSLVNFTDGGQDGGRGCIPTKKTRLKISKLTKIAMNTPEMFEKLSDGQKRRWKNTNLNEWSRFMKNVMNNPETREKLHKAAAEFGKRVSQMKTIHKGNIEKRVHFSEVNTFIKNGYVLGKKQIDYKKVLINGVVYNSTNEASKILNISFWKAKRLATLV